MPELPEVETMVRGVRQVAQGDTILSLREFPCKCRRISYEPGFSEIKRGVEGVSVKKVGRLGKRCLFYLESESVLVFEPRMSGILLVSDPPNEKHLRIEIQFGSGKSVLYWDQRGLGWMRLYDGTAFQELTERLGKDALEMTLEDWRQLGQTTTRPIKVALLDQSLVAGIGNLYASEILHLALIHPETPANKLTPSQLKRLESSNLKVLRAAIDSEGSTLRDGTYRNSLNQSGDYQQWHRVYDREGAECLTCASAHIVRTVQAQRSTFHCPRCQNKSGGRRSPL